MIIDFAVRPPYKGFLSLFPIYKSPPSPKSWRHVSPWSYECEPAPSKVQQSMELFITEMDEAGIGQAVLIGRQTNSSLFGAVSNDDLAELNQLYPGRFHAIGGVDLTDIPSAVAEVERVVGELGFKGITVHPGWYEPPMVADDERFYPIYEKCQELDAILAVTFSLFMGPDLEYVTPVRLQRIAAAFPDLLIVVAHGGWPYVMEFLGVAFMHPNVWLAPDFYVFRDGLPGASHFVEAANFYLADRFLFSSVYPSRPLKQSVEEFKQLPLRPDVMEKALYKNAEWILGDREPWPEGTQAP